MITHIFMRENLSFKKVDLKFDNGLVVFSGLSGAGKSILFKGILSAFGLCENDAKFVELQLNDELNLQDYGIYGEGENTFKMLKEKSTKYFINNQNIAKKSLVSLSKNFVKYLSSKENNEFSKEKFLFLLDCLQMQKEPIFKDFKEEFISDFKELSKIKDELKKIENEERQILELKELAQSQIERISSINPKIGEYEELLSLKKRLSKKDKIEEAWARAGHIFDYERAVIDALNLCEIDNTFFSDCLNELRIIAQNQNFEEFEMINIESILDRIEDLSYLIRRYESIENALLVLDEKKKELLHYENLSFEKDELQKKLEKLKDIVNKKAKILSDKRKANLPILQGLLNDYLKNLYMKNVELCLFDEELSSLGKDNISLNIDKTMLKNLSSGELNRLRLAFIATECKITSYGSGIIFLDEIDANLSGKEAMSVANVLNELAKFYQIFAISHLPQLSSRAQNHFLVEKINNESFVRKLNKDERANELARMVSGELVSEEALSFAKTLLNE